MVSRLGGVRVVSWVFGGGEDGRAVGGRDKWMDGWMGVVDNVMSGD